MDGSDLVGRKITQDIPDEFLTDLRDSRFASRNERMGNFHKVASLPVAVVEKWIAEGFNVFDKNVTVPEILKRLSAESLTDFIATNRRIG